MLPTPHIEADRKRAFAKTVIMPGDPLRAKYIAEKYLEDIVRVNTVRNMLAYTGTYKGVKVSIMGSGMGMPSMGIYSYELFNDYDVDNIIRVGSCGSYKAEFEVYDVLLITDSYCESSFAQIASGETAKMIQPSKFLNDQLTISAKRQNIKIKEAVAHTSDVFYRKDQNDYKTIVKKYGCDIVEMECSALFANAKLLGKNASAVITVSDCFVTGNTTTSMERQESFVNMMEVALGIVSQDCSPKRAKD